MKAIELKNQLLNYSDEELSELDFEVEIYDYEEEDVYCVSSDIFFILKKAYSQFEDNIVLKLTSVDSD